MSPYSFVGSYAYVFFVNASGNLSNHNVYDANIGVHPVINLKAGTLTKGTGTDIDPFTIE